MWAASAAENDSHGYVSTRLRKSGAKVLARENHSCSAQVVPIFRRQRAGAVRDVRAMHRTHRPPPAELYAMAHTLARMRGGGLPTHLLDPRY
jgi:hypothetical protein